jgi:hypothetical protein
VDALNYWMPRKCNQWLALAQLFGNPMERSIYIYWFRVLITFSPFNFLFLYIYIYSLSKHGRPSFRNFFIVIDQ